MPRYIDAEGLNLYDDLFMSENTINKSGVYVRYKDVENLIKNAPTADVQEVKHGKWEVLSRGLTLINAEGTLPLSYQLRQCSECKYVTVAAQPETHKWCPHCGAKMIETPSVQKYIDRAREQLLDAQRRLQNHGDDALKENINAALFYIVRAYEMELGQYYDSKRI